MEMNGVVVDYDKKTGRFLITSPQWMVGIARGIPNRRWNKSQKVWTAPAVRKNIEYIREKYMGAKFTIEAKDAIRDVLEMVAVRKRKPFPRDYPFIYEPFGHQFKALDASYDVHAFALFMDMRTGKTKVVIDKFTQHCIDGGVDRVVVACPMSVRKTWLGQIDEHCPVDVDVMPLNMKKQKQVKEWIGKPHPYKILVIALESLSQGGAFEIAKSFMLTGACAMAVDESSRIKNHKSIVAQRCVSLGLMAKFRVVMTGTPTTQGIMDIYMQFEFLDTNIIGIGDFYSFRNRYAIMGGYENKQIIGYDNVEELMQIIAPYTFQITKEEALPDAPQKIGPLPRYIQMNPAQKKIYNEIKKNKVMRDKEGGERELSNILEVMLRLQQTVGGFWSYKEPHAWKIKKNGEPVMETVEGIIEGKNPKIEDMLYAIEETGGSTIIWARFKMEIRMITEALAKKYGADQVVQFYGDVNENDRELARLQFQNCEKRFFVGNPHAGGIGLDLSAAKNVFCYSNYFSYEDRRQSEERPHGPEQKLNVLHVDLIMEGSVDEDILGAVSTKRDVADYVRDMIRRNEPMKGID